MRVVPRVERGERVNVGVVLFAREARFLAARIELDAARLRALAPEADVALIERHLATFVAICDGRAEGGPVAALPPAERFHWLTAPRSTIIQTSPVHAGATTDPAATLEDLLAAFVRPPGGTAGKDRPPPSARGRAGPGPPPLRGSATTRRRGTRPRPTSYR